MTLGFNTAKNTDYYKKKILVEVVENLIPYKKLSGRTCLSSPTVELGGSKECHV